MENTQLEKCRWSLLISMISTFQDHFWKATRVVLFKKQADLESLEEAQNSLEEAGRLAMAGGIIGVLIGLVNMLMHMDDPAALGPAMSMCLLTALYGTFSKYIILRPLACIAEDRAKQLDENI